MKCMNIKKEIRDELDYLDEKIIDKIKEIKKIDILFIGLINERRLKYIK